MGVIGLWSYMVRKKKTFFERVDLVQIAKSRPNGIHIIVDFYSWEHYMKSLLFTTLESLVGHPYLLFDGGEYRLIHDFITNFIEALRRVGIELVFYLDGAKGSSAFATEQKWATWQNRHEEEQKKLLQVMDFFRGKIPYSSINLDHMTRPCLQELQNLITLQGLGCALHQCVAGEADSFIAEHMLRDENAFAIFSNDTDFCIFHGSILLHEELFDLGNDLCMGSSTLSVKTPDKLICDIISSDHVRRRFGLSGTDCLTEFSIIQGNDFTGPFLKRLRSRPPKIEDTIEMVKTYAKAEFCPPYSKMINENPQLQSAVHHSRKFYNMELEEEGNDSRLEEFQLILSKVRQCLYPSSIIAMWKSFYWHRHIMEEPSMNVLPAEEALMPLRAYVYAILLPRNIRTVSEYGRSHSSSFDRMIVCKAEDRNIPPLLIVSRNSFENNLRIFEYILSHQEQSEIQVSFFQQYGVWNGFIYILLRYFLLLNWYQNLHIRPREFKTLCAWVMGKHDVQRYQTMKIVPSPRCITIENWFLLLFRLTHAFLGNILNLSHAFPKPAELFSGATWVALYTATAVTDPNPRTAEPAPLSVPHDELMTICEHVFYVVSQHKQVVSGLIDNVFQLHS